MGLSILLVNPNRFENPPVLPIGLEYLLSALEKHGHNAEILDLCFSNSPEDDLNNALTKTYDIVGFTIRNIDSALFYNNEFFLPKFKEYIKIIKNHGVPVILGGSGFSAMPNEILDYLEADYGIVGPGETMFPLFLANKPSDLSHECLFYGHKTKFDLDLVHYRAKKIFYPQYISTDGIVGFTTSYGCSGQCPYCIEAGTWTFLRTIPNIIEELRHLAELGYKNFHTCDCEFNINLRHSVEFCRALKHANLGINWALYMKPTPYNDNLFQFLKESGANLITLTVDSMEEIQKQNLYSYNDLEKIIEYCQRYEIKLAIDLLTGYPHETKESIKKIINFFKENRPSRVGIGYIYRVYNHTKLAEQIRQDKALQTCLTRPYDENENFLEPIFYKQDIDDFVKDLIKDDDLFELSGITPGVNYQLTE